jgi:D-lactate dehydrogenase
MHTVCFTDVEQKDRQLIREIAKGYKAKVFTKHLSDEELMAKCRDAEVLCPMIYTKVTPAVIDGLPKLKLISARSTGYDNIDVAYAKQKGIAVSNIPDYGANTVAEHTIALLLSVARHIPRAHHHVKRGKFQRHRHFRGMDLAGKTFGIVGTGRIGVYTARLAKGFGMNLLAYDVIRNEAAASELGFAYVPLEELLAKSDVVSIHVPLLDSTKHLINEARLAQMKKGAILLNTSRGGVVDTNAIVKGLEAGILGGVGLDVIEDEQGLTRNHPILRHRNVVITPHIASYTHEAQRRILEKTVENINKFYEGTLKSL